MEEPVKKKKGKKKVVIPHREPTVIFKPRPIVYITADKLTCKECPCFPPDDIYVKKKKLNSCLKNPLSLYELAAAAVDHLTFPEAFSWSEKQVVDWIENEVGLPQYRECFLDNYINGRRLLMLSDPSYFPEINIHYFEHIKMITAKIRNLFSIEFIEFSRSVSLPPLKPLTHCTWFKSRTGPPWGIQQNWTRSDVLRWMQIIKPKPVHMNHWDFVWYTEPDFPKTLFGRVKAKKMEDRIPKFEPPKPKPCLEYMVPRKFPLHHEIPDQKIWMERRPDSPKPTEHEWLAALKLREAEAKMKIYKPTRPKKNRLDPPVIDPTCLRGKALILGRRLMPKKKFSDYTSEAKHKKK